MTGVAGIFAGAFSMAVGEWLSITAENEYMAKEIETEREHIIAHRQEENVELIEYLVEQGLQEDTARQVVADLETRPDATARLLNMHARFHWGIDGKEEFLLTPHPLPYLPSLTCRSLKATSNN